MLDVNIVTMKTINKHRNGKHIPDVVKVKVNISIKGTKGQEVFGISDNNMNIIDKYSNKKEIVDVNKFS